MRIDNGERNQVTSEDSSTAANNTSPHRLSSAASPSPASPSPSYSSTQRPAIEDDAANAVKTTSSNSTAPLILPLAPLTNDRDEDVTNNDDDDDDDAQPSAQFLPSKGHQKRP